MAEALTNKILLPCWSLARLSLSPLWNSWFQSYWHTWSLKTQWCLNCATLAMLLVFKIENMTSITTSYKLQASKETNSQCSNPPECEFMLSYKLLYCRSYRIINSNVQYSVFVSFFTLWPQLSISDPQTSITCQHALQQTALGSTLNCLICSVLFVCVCVCHHVSAYEPHQYLNLPNLIMPVLQLIYSVN